MTHNGIHIGLGARAWTCLLALCLLIPSVGIATQDDAALADFHNRSLAAWPPTATFSADPVAYFQHSKSWLADRVYPIKQVTELQKSVVYYAFRSAPEASVTLGRDDHIFLNGGSIAEINELFEKPCIRGHRKRSARALEGTMAAWAAVGRGGGYAVDVIVIPTSATIYADKLPHQVPAIYRGACAERMRGNSPLHTVRPADGVTFLYPLREMLVARDDEAFFPRGNWHPTGLSLKVVRDAYLAKLSVKTTIDEVLERGVAPAEIMLPYGIHQAEPTYFVRNRNLTAESKHNAALRDAIANLFGGGRMVTHVFSNTKPVVDQSVLMLSDSFGERAAETFAGAFRNLIQITTNDLQRGQALQVVKRVRHLHPIDRVILLIQEGNTRRIANWHR